MKKNPSQTSAAKVRALRLPSGATSKEFVGMVGGPFHLESKLENWLEEHFHQLAADAVYIGRQIPLGRGKSIDMLGIFPDGNFCILELKRDEAETAAVAQLIEYASLMEQALRIDLDDIVQQKRGKTLAAFYEETFAVPFPTKRPNQPTLMVVAASISADAQNLVLHLNQHHRFRFELITYVDPNSNVTDEVPKLNTVVRRGDRFPAAGPMPDRLLMLRFRETKDELWSDVMKGSTIHCESFAAEMFRRELEQGDLKVLIYLNQSGYVGLGRVPKSQPGTGPGACHFQIEWESVVAREQAQFISEKAQPSEPAVVVKDPELWSKAWGLLRFYAREPRRIRSHGAARRPYQGSKPRTGQPTSTSLVAKP